MSARAAVPFLLKRGEDVMTATSYESTRETIHGVVRLEGDRLVLQWRLERKRDVMGDEMRTDKELERVREVEVPLEGVAGATVRSGWLGRLTGPRLVLTAGDLAAFEVVAGEDGLRMDHPAQLRVRTRRADRLLAEEFCAELALALAERSMDSALPDRAGHEPGEDALSRPLADPAARPPPSSLRPDSSESERSASSPPPRTSGEP